VNLSITGQIISQ